MFLFFNICAAISVFAQSYPGENIVSDVQKVPPESVSNGIDFKMTPEKSIFNKKIDSVLNEVIEKFMMKGYVEPQFVEEKSLRLSQERVQVHIVVSPKMVETVYDLIDSHGGEATGINIKGDVIQAWVPISELGALAEDPNVFLIRKPAEAVLFEGNSETEALDDIDADSWHTAGYTGAGVKVAVIDGGFLDFDDRIASGDLPSLPPGNIKNFVDGETDPDDVNGTTKHGTACAEIVYDLAPGAEMYLAKISTNIDLNDAVTWAMSNSVDIITTSLGWYNLTPGDGTGEFADLVASARSAGIFWSTAAGNDRESHWGGAFSDTDANDWHEFTAGQEINYFGPGSDSAYVINPGYTFRVYLRWDDWTSVDQNYDLKIYRFNGGGWDLIGSSIDEQDGSPGQTPTEFAMATTSGDPAPYGFAINRWDSDRNVNFEVFVPKFLRPDELTTPRSLANLADAPDAMTVAALDVNSPYPQESYSSEGPTNGPGGTAGGGFIKPDISAYANVSTEAYGVGGFNGTSAATPHVAGAAALVLSAYPSYTPDQVQTFLENHAVDMGTAGMDTIYGYGRLNLGVPPMAGDCAWLGGSTDWDLSGNWSCGFIPGNTDPVEIPGTPANGSNFPIIDATVSAEALSVTIEGGFVSITANGLLTLG